MTYKPSKEQFLNSKMFDSNGRFFHKVANRFKLFPYVTQPSTVNDLDSIVGGYLCRIEGIKPSEKEASELFDELKKEITIDLGHEETFYEIIRQLYYNDDGSIRPINIEFIKQIQCKENAQLKMIDYLVDVLGNREELKVALKEARDQYSRTNNVLEALVLSKFEYEPVNEESTIPYFRITESLHKVYEEDFKYVLGNTQLSRDHLTDLMSFYYFSYSAQTCLQLNRMLDGDRYDITPLYFSVEWEKTSQSRLCYTEGWQKLQRSIRRIFAHAVVLELLNQTEEGSPIVDYIELNNIIKSHPDLESDIAEEIKAISDEYRSNINDCSEMTNLQKEESPEGRVATEVNYLFNSVRVQFENVRTGPYTKYSNKLEEYCNLFLKPRGRIGMLLNLSEEMLIFLTRLCIKDNEQMRLKEVFEEFEKRGVFLDNYSKDQVTDYYERLNLIEKKSDSGDAKYVKRIL